MVGGLSFLIYRVLIGFRWHNECEECCTNGTIPSSLLGSKGSAHHFKSGGSLSEKYNDNISLWWRPDSLPVTSAQWWWSFSSRLSVHLSVFRVFFLVLLLRYVKTAVLMFLFFQKNHPWFFQSFPGLGSKRVIFNIGHTSESPRRF